MDFVTKNPVNPAAKPLQISRVHIYQIAAMTVLQTNTLSSLMIMPVLWKTFPYFWTNRISRQNIKPCLESFLSLLQIYCSSLIKIKDPPTNSQILSILGSVAGRFLP